MSPMHSIVSALDARRRELGMSRAVVARLAGVSERTVQRLLSGEAENVRVGTLAAIGEVVGATIRLSPTCGTRVIRRRQAKRKARRLVALAQGSAALEGQAVPSKELEKLIQKVADRLAVGNGIRLWSEP